MNIFLLNTFKVASELAPWLFLGVFLSSIVHYFVPDSFFKKHLGGSGFKAVVKSVLIGVPMPLCSCSVIPVALSLKKQGAGTPASVSFLISTPQTGLDSVFVSASMLGWPFAIFKLISALILGLVGGALSIFTSSEDTGPKENLRDEVKKKEEPFRSIYEYAINDLLYMVWRWLVLGIFVSAAITTWLPSEILSGMGGENLLLILIGVLAASVPLYVCATSSVPIAAALVHGGVPLSAALVFLIAGPATNLATIGAVYKTLGGRQLFIYLSVIILGSLGLAYAFDYVVAISEVHGHHEHSGLLNIISAVIMIFLFIKFGIKELLILKTSKNLSAAEHVLLFKIEDMKCRRCVNKIKESFADCERLSLEFNLENKTLLIAGEGAEYSEIKQILHNAGFCAELLK